MGTTRIRTFDNRVETRRHYKWQQFNPALSGGDDNLTGVLEGSLVQVYDNNNRDFRKIQKAGGIIMSDCSIVKWTRSFVPGDIVYDPNANWHATQSGDILGTLAGQVGEPTVNLTLESAGSLLVKAYANINSSPLMTGEMLSDLGQTVGMLKRPFRGASELINNMIRYKQKRVGKTAKSATKANADAWLEYRYGWTPLILDGNTIIKEATRKRDACQRSRLVARSGGATSDTVTYANSNAGSYGISSSCSVTKLLRRSVGVMYEVKNRTSSEELARFTGTRARDLGSTLWETIPYSFVVDWFTNVGDWIQAVTPDPSIVMLGNWSTDVTETTTLRSAFRNKDTSNPPYSNWWGSYGNSTVKQLNYTRTCGISLPSTPELTGRSLSVLRQADAMSLLVKPILGALKGFRH